MKEKGKEGKGREGKRREGKRREEKGRGGKRRDAFEVEQEGAVVNVDEPRLDHNGDGGGGHIHCAATVAVRTLEVLQNTLGDGEPPFRPRCRRKRKKKKKRKRKKKEERRKKRERRKKKD